uniref:Uncharacterized protein n=1 Tax=viral metagenome TaxID=1070528 RepID=A0A6C0M173_9ZZZZ
MQTPQLIQLNITKINNICNIYTHINANNKMDKQKKEKIREIDVAIVGCATGQACDEAELVRLAIEYATEFHCAYQLSAAHMRSLETDAERGRALQLEVNVNNVIRYTMRRTMPGMAGLSRLVMERFTDQPKPTPRGELARTCKCSATRRSPQCKLSPQFCKYTPLMKAFTRRKTRSASPKTRSPKTRSPKTRSASPKTRSASPKTRK